MATRRLTTANLDYWQAKMPEFAVCMAWDAFALALGQPTHKFHPDDVRRWLDVQRPAVAMRMPRRRPSATTGQET